MSASHCHVSRQTSAVRARIACAMTGMVNSELSCWHGSLLYGCMARAWTLRKLLPIRNCEQQCTHDHTPVPALMLVPRRRNLLA